MEKESLIQRGVKKATQPVIYIGIAAIILGIIVVAYPAGIGRFSAVVIGVFLLLGGFIRLIFAVVSFSMGSLIMRYLYAILMMVVGIWMVSNPDSGLNIITMIMAIYFIVDGITEIGYSFSLMPMGGGLFLLISGVIGLILGVLIFYKWPESSNYALGIYLGIKLMVDGSMLSMTAYAIRKSAKNI
jgi:uncharacterized membrane protein HdeD (DUF308 family)